MTYRVFIFTVALLLGAAVASAQGPMDRDMILVEPCTTQSGAPLQNLINCVLEITDATLLMETRTIPASSPTGCQPHTFMLDGKIGHTNVEAYCHNTLVEASLKAQLARTFPGDPSATPLLQD